MGTLERINRTVLIYPAHAEQASAKANVKVRATVASATWVARFADGHHDILAPSFF